MKSIELPISISPTKTTRLSIPVYKKLVYYSLLLVTAVGGFFLPLLFIAFGCLAIGGSALYCQNLYKEISTLDFTTDKFSITLEEIIEDLEG